ncbi:MAG TPA: hypothetical protein VLX59_05910 [Acidimicrobiales bacterium]|nr:hypothetical protein [Acidimicrobiales bacterium]
MSGPSDYPSTGYVTVTDGQPGGPIHLTTGAADPEDGFTAAVGVVRNGTHYGDARRQQVTRNPRN